MSFGEMKVSIGLPTSANLSFYFKHKFERHNVMASIVQLAVFPLKSVLESAHFMSCSRPVTSQNIIHCLKKTKPSWRSEQKYCNTEVIRGSCNYILCNYRIPVYTSTGMSCVL